VVLPHDALERKGRVLGLEAIGIYKTTLATGKPMDPTLHQKQGINHLQRVLAYAPLVAENGRAQVHLTQEDWFVVADTLFRMHTPRELLPAEILDYRLTNENRTIELRTPELTIEVEMF
jgi:hypothetical protein